MEGVPVRIGRNTKAAKHQSEAGSAADMKQARHFRRSHLESQEKDFHRNRSLMFAARCRGNTAITFPKKGGFLWGGGWPVALSCSLLPNSRQLQWELAGNSPK